MFKDRTNPALNGMKVESTQDAINRGVMIQTTFFTKSERKKKDVDENLKETKYNATADMFDAAMYKAYNLK